MTEGQPQTPGLTDPKEKQILIVDDDESILDLLEHMLKREVLAVDASLRAALDQARALRRHDLRLVQTRRALEGSDRMLIWLGIQELGQRRQPVVTEESRHPMTVAELVASVARREDEETERI